MPQIVVSIDGKTYRMACAEGEEAHLQGLAAEVDARMTELRGSFGEIGDLRLTVMAAIMATDELDEQRRRVAALEAEIAQLQDRQGDASHFAAQSDQRLTDHLLGVSDVIERITLKLEQGLSAARAGPLFDDAFRENLGDLLRWRRDVRRFRPDPLPPGTLERLVATASLAPSVGLCEPWRFVEVADAKRRVAVRASFERENRAALGQQAGERAALYAGLKLAGFDAAPVQFAVFAEPDPEQGHGLGRRTMVETAAYSTVMAVHTLWLAARADGIGLGWVSILDPAEIGQALDVPKHWTFIGYFCLGYPVASADTPELERAGWEHRRPAAERLIRR